MRRDAEQLRIPPAADILPPDGPQAAGAALPPGAGPTVRLCALHGQRIQHLLPNRPQPRLPKGGYLHILPSLRLHSYHALRRDSGRTIAMPTASHSYWWGSSATTRSSLTSATTLCAYDWGKSSPRLECLIFQHKLNARRRRKSGTTARNSPVTCGASRIPSKSRMTSAAWQTETGRK